MTSPGNRRGQCGSAQNLRNTCGDRRPILRAGHGVKPPRPCRVGQVLEPSAPPPAGLAGGKCPAPWGWRLAARFKILVGAHRRVAQGILSFLAFFVLHLRATKLFAALALDAEHHVTAPHSNMAIGWQARRLQLSSLVTWEHAARDQSACTPGSGRPASSSATRGIDDEHKFIGTQWLNDFPPGIRSSRGGTERKIEAAGRDVAGATAVSRRTSPPLYMARALSRRSLVHRGTSIPSAQPASAGVGGALHHTGGGAPPRARRERRQDEADQVLAADVPRRGTATRATPRTRAPPPRRSQGQGRCRSPATPGHLVGVQALSRIDSMPRWPAGLPERRNRRRPSGMVHLVVDHQHRRGCDGVALDEAARRVAAAVHVRLRSKASRARQGRRLAGRQRGGAPHSTRSAPRQAPRQLVD